VYFNFYVFYAKVARVYTRGAKVEKRTCSMSPTMKFSVYKFILIFIFVIIPSCKYDTFLATLLQ